MKIKVFTVTKNEYDLIEDWILYYGNLVGFENVVVIDNGSDDDRVIEIYKKFKYDIEIVTKMGFEGENQGTYFTEMMNCYKAQADFLIGTDTDEFLVFNNKNTKEISINPYTIHEEFVNLPVRNSIGYINVHINSCSFGQKRFVRPTVEMTKFNRGDLDDYPLYNGPMKCNKVFYRADRFIRTSNGNHAGKTTDEGIPYWPSLAYLHFHDLGTERNLERAYGTILGYKFIDKTDNKEEMINKLRRAQNGYGNHRVVEYIEFLERGLTRSNQVSNFETNLFKDYLLKLKA